MNIVSKKRSWVWYILFLLYVFASISNIAVFFNRQSPVHLYYQILMGFDMSFMIPYLLNILAIILDILIIVPFYNFLNPTKHRIGLQSISQMTWKAVFAIRFALIFIGRGYELKQIQAILYHDIWVSLSVANILLLLYAPSYFATFIYIFNDIKSQKEF